MRWLLAVSLASVLLLPASVAIATDPATDQGAGEVTEFGRQDDAPAVTVTRTVDEDTILATPRYFPVIPAARTVIQQ